MPPLSHALPTCAYCRRQGHTRMECPFGTLASLYLERERLHLLCDVVNWCHAQGMRVQQHPSYARLHASIYTPGKPPRRRDLHDEVLAVEGAGDVL